MDTGLQDQIVESWRECIGTKFHHMGRVLGVAMDCGGLILHPTRTLPIEGEDFPTAYERFPRHSEMFEHLSKYMDKICLEQAEPGDVIGFAHNGGKQTRHLAGISHLDPIRIIHALFDFDPRGMKVQESHLSKSWRSQITGCFRYRVIDPYHNG